MIRTEDDHDYGTATIDWEAAMQDILPRVYSFFLYKLKSREEAEDLAEEVMERVWKNRHSFCAERGSFSVWVMRIARNLKIDFFRNNRPTAGVDELEYQPSNHSPPEESVIRQHILRQLMRELNTKERELITLRYGAGLSCKEIGMILNTRISALCTEKKDTEPMKPRSINPFRTHPVLAGLITAALAACSTYAVGRIITISDHMVVDTGQPPIESWRSLSADAPESRGTVIRVMYEAEHVPENFFTVTAEERGTMLGTEREIGLPEYLPAGFHWRADRSAFTRENNDNLFFSLHMFTADMNRSIRVEINLDAANSLYHYFVGEYDYMPIALPAGIQGVIIEGVWTRIADGPIENDDSVRTLHFVFDNALYSIEATYEDLADDQELVRMAESIIE